MARSNKFYPSPVLGNGDDIQGIFEAKMVTGLSSATVSIDSEYILNNSTIEQLILDKKATFTMQVECSNTFFRVAYTSFETEHRVEINSMELRGKVTVTFLVNALEDIPNYHPAGLHGDYGDTPFAVFKGDVLAFGDSGSFIADKEFDPLSAPIGSFFRVVKSGEKEAPISVDYDNEMVTIYLADKDHEDYTALVESKTAEDIIHGSLVFPVLVEAIFMSTMKKMQNEGLLWLERLTDICNEKKLDTDFPFEVAQKLLGNPASRSFASARKILDQNDEDKE